MRLYHMGEFGGAASAVALGTFDGVHLGHQALLREAVSAARRLGLPALALTFDRHPLSVVKPESAPPALCGPEEKRRVMAELGLDGVVEWKFTPEFARQTPEEFIRLPQGELRPAAMAAGFNYSFGASGSGSSATLRHLGEELGFESAAFEPVCVDGEPVSSSRIRSLLMDGEIKLANRLLGRPYRLELTREGQEYLALAGRVIPRNGRYLGDISEGNLPPRTVEFILRGQRIRFFGAVDSLNANIVLLSLQDMARENSAESLNS